MFLLGGYSAIRHLYDEGMPDDAASLSTFGLYTLVLFSFVIVLLFSQATNGLGRSWPRKLLESKDMVLDRPFTRLDVLNGWNPAMKGDVFW
jgi:hypothetical protein